MNRSAARLLHSLFTLAIGFGLLLFAASLAGCGAAESVIKYAEIGGKYMTLTEPILRQAHNDALAACHKKPTGAADIICQEKVNAVWAPILETMGQARAAYCAIDAEKCAEVAK